MKAIIGCILGPLAILAGSIPQGTASWACIEPLPAVVNPVGREASTELISLRGKWEFCMKTKPGANRNAVWGVPFACQNWSADRFIYVPGCWEAQGVGEPGMAIPWDAWWDHSAKPIRHKCMGEGWYRKEVMIPTAWAGKKVWLKIGGVRAQGWFWVNNHQVAWVDDYCGTYKYDVTAFVEPGKAAKIVACVDNRLPSRKGLMSLMHRWGGIYRDVELEATPETRIDDAWVRGDFDKAEAEAHVVVGGTSAARVRVTIEGRFAEAPVATNGETVVRLPLKNFRPWSPEHPNLYWADIVLQDRDGKIVHARRERFGIRKLEVRGEAIYLNNRPYFFRGFGDDHVYPLTGITPADRAEHLKHLMKAHEAGFNFVRLHTHCEVPEYFEAADEAGILIEAELPYYTDVPCEAFPFDPARDARELCMNYRRYPSFAVYSGGNEGGFGAELGQRLYQLVKAMDPDRLMIAQDGGCNAPGNSDYQQGQGPIKVWPRGTFHPDRPFVTHEYLNLCVKQDSRLEKAYTGIWEVPMTRAKRAEWLGRFGLDLAWGDALQDAQHGLQRYYQQQGIEAARADPYCDGHCFWTIVDVVVEQGETYTAQGLLDPFWNVKRNGSTLADFRLFNGPQAILLDTDPVCRVLTSGDRVKADFLFANFGEAPVEKGEIAWTFGAEERRTPVAEIEIGNAKKVAEDSFVAPAVEKPCKMLLAASLASATNQWEFWVFPKRAVRDGSGLAVEKSLMPALSKLYRGLVPAETADAPIVIAPGDSDIAAKALAAGKRVLAISGTEGSPNVSLGWWTMGDQVGTAFAKGHPALGVLPHEGYLSPLMFRLVKKTGLRMPVKGISPEDMVVVGEGGKACYLYLASAKIGKGEALLAFGLDVVSGTPEGTCILDGMLDTLRSDSFHPQSTFQSLLAISAQKRENVKKGN